MRLPSRLALINKKLGISPQEIIKKVEMSDGFIKKNFSKDLGAYLEKVQKEAQKEREDQIEDVVDDGDFEEELSSVFWEVWTDFDKYESKKLANYERVTFVMEGASHSFVGASISLIHMRAADMWRAARELGSNAYVTKYISVDGKKLKYVIE